MRIANRAKTLSGGRNYALANILFAAVLEVVFTQRSAGTWCVPVSNLEKEGVTTEVVLETQDTTGACHREAYYDLLVVECLNKEGILEGSLCIPLPLLDPLTLGGLLKKVTIGAKRDHDRDFEVDNAELLTLWDRVLSEIDPGTLLDLATSHLTPKAMEAMVEVIPV